MVYTIISPDFSEYRELDDFVSMIWTERYNTSGDFEFFTKVSDNVSSLLHEDWYIYSDFTDREMIIESIEIETDSENGNTLKMTGRSLESILNRRILLSKVSLTGSFQSAIVSLLNSNIISPTDANRKIENISIKLSDDPVITSLTIEAQYDKGHSLYDTIVSMCQSKNIGFKITRNLDNMGLIFELYAGKNYSYAQEVNNYVVFSPNEDNIISSNYLESKENYKNIIVVDADETKTLTISDSETIHSGLFRREFYVDANDISNSTSETLTDSEIYSQMRQRASETFKEYDIIKTFEGEMDTTNKYKYGQDFGLGDVVQIVNEYNIEDSVRVVEIVFSQDDSGITTFPSFETIKEDI